MSDGSEVQDSLSALKRRRGYILIMFALSLLFLLGVVGLAVDIGRMYVAKSEAQSFADAAALNGAVELAVTPGGFTSANNAANQTAKQWDIGTRAFTDVTTTFGTNADGPFTASPADSSYSFVKVTARASVPLYFLPVVVGATHSPVAAAAVAGQQTTTGLSGGEIPFSPYSRKDFSPDDPNDPFGFKIGNTYTLRWGAKGGGTYSTCDGGLDEANYTGYNGASFRGYCCTGSNNVPDLARAIMTGGGTVPVEVGDAFDPLITAGQKSVIDSAFLTYINYDTDITSTTYAEYKAAGNGNGKRLVVVPVNGLVDGVSTVVGFAAFFLLTPDNYPKTPAAKACWCAEYVGQLVQGVPGLPPGTGSGVYHLKIFR